MNTFGRVEKKRRGARAGHCRRDFLSDKTGLSHAGHDDLALATKQQIDGSGELGIQSIDERLHGARFDFQHTPTFGKTVAVAPVG
jgi:hypothetical protein